MRFITLITILTIISIRMNLVMIRFVIVVVVVLKSSWNKHRCSMSCSKLATIAGIQLFD